MRLRNEGNYQKKIAENYRIQGWQVIRTDAMPNGIPDLLLFKCGKVVGMEVKKKGNTMSPIQKVFAENAQFPVVQATVQSPQVFTVEIVPTTRGAALWPEFYSSSGQASDVDPRQLSLFPSEAHEQMPCSPESSPPLQPEGS